jgi:hypothetical protein
MTTSRRIALSLAIILPLAAGTAAAQTSLATATQDVNYTVAAIDQLGVNDPSVSLTLAAAGAGTLPAPDSVASSYSITTNSTTTRTITGSIDSDLTGTTGLTLKVKLDAPGGASVSNGYVALGTTAADLVTGISSVSNTSVPVNYELSASTPVAPTTGSVTVTYTLVGN